ncbi:MAG: hypothetical protein L0Z62_48480 [Gemmataceae bacterium]|nr:hypothetical protein [Gemmataceae bacterium]
MTALRPLPAADALDRYFLEARCKLLDVAAILDRIDRGGAQLDDPRLAKVRQALAILHDTSAGESDRAEQLQQLFSLDYDPDWQKKFQLERR